MAGGIIIDAIAILACVGGLKLFADAQDHIREFGDHPNLPEGLRGHGRKPGGGGGKAAPAQVRTDDIAHRGQGR